MTVTEYRILEAALTNIGGELKGLREEISESRRELRSVGDRVSSLSTDVRVLDVKKLDRDDVSQLFHLEAKGFQNSVGEIVKEQIKLCREGQPQQPVSTESVAHIQHAFGLSDKAMKIALGAIALASAAFALIQSL